MGNARHCPDWEEKLSLYIDGVLNPFDENAVEAHLARCAGCREAVALWRAVGQAIRNIPQAAPPAYLREWILASTSRRPRRVSRRAWFPWRALAPTVGLALVLSWLTLPSPNWHSVLLSGSIASAAGSLEPASGSVPSLASPYAPLVVVVPAHAVYRAAPLASQGAVQTRLHATTDVFQPVPTPLPTTETLTTAPSTVAPIMEGRSGSLIIPTIGGVLSPTLPAFPPPDWAGWLQSSNPPRTRKRPTPNGTVAPNKDRAAVPVVIIVEQQ